MFINVLIQAQRIEPPPTRGVNHVIVAQVFNLPYRRLAVGWAGIASNTCGL